MKIGLLTCEKLPELAKHSIIAKAEIWNDKNNKHILLYLFYKLH